MDKNKLVAAMALAGYTQKRLCDEIGMSRPTFIRKVRDGTFGTDEVKRIQVCLHLTNDQIMSIFFS